MQLVVDSQNHHIGLREGRQHGVERRDQQRGQRQIQRRRDADGVELFVKPCVGAQVASAQPQRELDGAVDDKVDHQRHHLPDAGGQRRPANPHLREGADAEDQHRVEDNVGDAAGQQGQHRLLHPAGRLVDLLKREADHDDHREGEGDAGILAAQLDHRPVVGEHPQKPRHQRDAHRGQHQAPGGRR